MKIRTGFVSNSSSSSFCVIFKKDEFDKNNCFSELKEKFDNETEDYDAECYQTEIFGIEAYVFRGEGYDCYTPEFIEEIEGGIYL